MSPDARKPQTTTETEKKNVNTQEEIIFSDNHNLDDYLIGK